MQLTSVLLARIFAFLPLEDLNPRGALRGTEITKGLIERYGFMGFPEKLEDYYDEQKGLQYLAGNLDKIVINKLAIYPAGITVDTRSSTSDSEEVLRDMLAWAVTSLNINYKEEMIKSRVYISQLTFTSDVTLDALNPKLRGFGERITKSVSKSFGHTFNFETASVTLHFDTSVNKELVTGFQIARRTDVPYSENKYFSSAPLPTDEHIKLVKDFEAALKS